MTYKRNIIKEYIAGEISREKASIKLEVSVKTITRMKNRYLKEGESAFVHKNTGKIPVNKTKPKREQKLLNAYEKYDGFNFSHFLEENSNVNLSLPTVTRILNKNGKISPDAHKKNKPKKEYLLRKRRKNFGELIQMDASIHGWLPNTDEKQALHLAIDDSVSYVVAGWFSKEETLDSYLILLKQILLILGIPLCFYTDKRTVFEYKNKKAKMDPITQFQRICNSFGTKIITTSVPQAKGRVERLNRTFQGRLLNELKLNNICTINEANKYLLNVFIPKLNERFAKGINENRNVFKPLPTNIDINFKLSIKSQRKVLNGNVICINNKLYKAVDNFKKEVILKTKQLVDVFLTLNKKLKVEYNNKVYDLLLFQENVNHKSHPTIKNHPWKNPNNYGKPLWQQQW
jgi:transposase